ncbi:hypothetical protein EYZ11_005505 [Aspergillus tanneri]|uniref:Uncharacterized protein n=1 Tax=Aspergillus tanneri TaxID=1220188 RepID=A0A4S3JHU2_9EURO|nr:uncharacterized protein ATNIH1004_002494 [Aspergillus tanneri]KAA8649817.1 hypothetical protein ATNIH1004_002494 [Aspergillus tanneri]THC95029.1 hypothetical protein EYZ11_005505 [Aspergillus tanneri]
MAVDEDSGDVARGPVEARSLSSITSIASQPPTYPRNPSQKKLDPLVLYIVRVPGSKDVFLSPLKPPTKASVSAEAINASLYYLHVATPDDEVLLQEYEQEREERARLRREGLDDEEADLPSEFARLNHVRRKPVPGGGGAPPPPVAAASPPSVPPALPARSLVSSTSLQPPPMPPRPPLSARSSVDFTGATPPDRHSFLGNPPDDQTTAPSRRPLPPVPRDESAFDAPEDRDLKKGNRWSALGGYFSRGPEIWKEKYEALSTGRHSLDSREPQMGPNTAHASSSYTRMGSPGRSPGQSPTRNPPESRPPDQPGFHITLIRRDPSHGSQWNVATMSTPRMDGGAIDIEVFTPGYKRFATQKEPFSLANLGINLPAEALNSLSLSGIAPPPAESGENGDAPPLPRRFHRKLCVSRPQEEARGSLDLAGSRPSLDSLGRPGSQGAGHSKLKSGYYTFQSPWNGTCTFSSSANGRSLKCKHMVSMPGFSPQPGNDNPAVTVAEIRFNTPFQPSNLPHQPGPLHLSPFTLSQIAGFKDLTGALDSGPEGTTSSPHVKRSSLAQILDGLSNRPRSRSAASTHSLPPPPSTPPGVTHKSSLSSISSADIDGPSSNSEAQTRPRPRPRLLPSEDRLDFTLARENAGGGMRGKSAKLGKLVIEDEGIKMLDLAVAACMAVWWRGYYY